MHIYTYIYIQLSYYYKKSNNIWKKCFYPFSLTLLLYYRPHRLGEFQKVFLLPKLPHALTVSVLPRHYPKSMPTYLLYPSPHWSRDSTLHQRSSTLEKYQADCWLAKLPNSLSCCSPSLKLHTILVAIFKFLTGLKTLHSHQRQSSIANVQAGYLSDRFLFFILSPILCFPSFHSPASTWGRDFPVYQRPYRLGETQAR